MNLANKEVIHVTYGAGNVVKYNERRIIINFKSGDKKFVFPDAFNKYVTFVDENATDLVKSKIKKKKEEREKQALIEALAIEKEMASEQSLQHVFRQKRPIQMMGGPKVHPKIHPEIQSVFWCEGEEEENRIFTEWRIFTGEIKSGKNQGQPKQFPRMNQNSGCLITRREPNMAEDERQIVGLFMANKSFNGSQCLDGYITADPEYRILLSEEESKKMLFWNYYVDKKSSDKTIWVSGRQRYFDNLWMAQILLDIISLKDKLQEKEDAQAFFEHFCRINYIDANELPNLKGALAPINN